jgi:hypothetical protein
VSLACPICLSSDLAALADKNYALMHPVASLSREIDLKFSYCKLCGHGFHSSESNIDLDRYYRTSPKRAVSSAGLNERESVALKKITSMVKSSFRGTAVEYGGGYSQLPAHLIEALDITLYLAVDPSFAEGGIEHPCANIDQFKCVASPEFQQLGESILIARQVIEHLDDPGKFLETCRSQIGPGSYFYIEVPNFDYTKKFSSWYDLCFEHFHYFTPMSMRRLLQRCGFSVSEIGFANNGHDFFALGRCVEGRGSAVEAPSEEPCADARPEWAPLPETYIAYGCNSNLESILNFSQAALPRHIFDDGASINKIYFDGDAIDVSPFSIEKLAEITKGNEPQIPIVIFAPFSSSQIRKKIPGAAQVLCIKEDGLYQL